MLYSLVSCRGIDSRVDSKYNVDIVNSALKYGYTDRLKFYSLSSDLIDILNRWYTDATSRGVNMAVFLDIDKKKFFYLEAIVVATSYGGKTYNIRVDITKVSDYYSRIVDLLSLNSSSVEDLIALVSSLKDTTINILAGAIGSFDCSGNYFKVMADSLRECAYGFI